jgi:hypothetical protein
MRPIIPQPGYTEADVEAVLASRQYAYADCYTITPRYGDPVTLTTRYRSMTVDVDGNPVTFTNLKTLQITGLRLKISVGTSVDEQEMGLSYTADSTLWGLPTAMAIRLGRLDAAVISRDRFFAQDAAGPWVGSVRLFRGRISTADRIDRASAELKIKSNLILLNTPMPSDLYQPSCNHVVYDAGCTLDRDDWSVTGTVDVGTTSSLIKSSEAIPELVLGSFYIDTEDGITIVRTVKEVDGDDIHLTYPLDFVPTPGMTFTAYQGCSRTRERCNEFSNEEHYKGFPYVPVAETAV